MKKIIVEWFRYEKHGDTCCRCNDSTEVVRAVVGQVRTANIDIEIELKEMALAGDMLSLSNTVRINGKDIMDILGERQRVLTDCPSCSGLIGVETKCNTYVYRGKIYDSLPEEMLIEAIYREAFEDEPGVARSRG
jgi:hypothetical protein